MNTTKKFWVSIMKIHEFNKQEALNNMTLKLTILNDALKKPENPNLEFYPKTVRQFNLWESKQNSIELNKRYGPIKKNANSTLNKYPEVKAELTTLLKLLTLAERNKEKNSKPERISKLKANIEELKKYILLLESYTATQKVELLRTKEHFEGEINKQNSIIRELKETIRNGH